ncbi:hypothetical protein [Rhizobium sp. L1K21]|uniref:hypothetical protein n=1 Tax=Rhizobium sp. L1K21 TaxID=2954933 RepID=UPI002092528F|nr:hypothetical protein [Rhizobium sp. L1K21]MCO6187192.1 hypothetical protein [Rhizobium sp. L1K21]
MNVQGIGQAGLFVDRSATSSKSREAAPSATDNPALTILDAVAGDDEDIGLYAQNGQAVAAMAQRYTAAPNGYEIYMPVREGYSSNNLALAITDPSAEPFSGGLTKAEVTEAARKSLDAQYARMKADGSPFQYNSFEGVDWYSAFGELDRRALNAITTDDNGLFTKEEKNVAQSIMSQQQGLAMGLYSGPTRLAGDFQSAHATFSDGTEGTMNMAKTAVEWLDKLSLDEKTTSRTWVEQRAVNQKVYEDKAKSLGREPDDLSSGSSFVDMLIRSMKELEDMGPDHGLTDTPSYSKVWTLFDQYRADMEPDKRTFFV